MPRDRSKETTRPVRLPEKLIAAAVKATGLADGPAVREMVRRGLKAPEAEEEEAKAKAEELAREVLHG